jgi:hypothetical protein
VHVVPGVIAIGVGACALWALKGTREARAELRDWPTVEGEITDRALERRPAAGRSAAYVPRFRYRYAVGGVEHRGDTRDLQWSSGWSKRVAERKLHAVPDEVPVRYDPADPARSALEPPGKGDNWFWGAFGVVFLALGAYLLAT